MRTNKETWENIQKRFNQILEKEWILRSKLEDCWTYKNNSNKTYGGTKYEMEISHRLCHFGISYKDNLDDFIAVMTVYTNGDVLFEIFKGNEFQLAPTGIYNCECFLTEEEFKSFASAIYEKIDLQNKEDVYIDDDFFTDEIKINENLFSDNEE